ncbi:MAG: hypothetical protein ABI821_09435 [Pseudomonadota bacterium]
MPITPFHFGAGAVFHAASPSRVSFLAFCAANCITDCETVYNVLAGRFPLHRFLHTFVGATLVAVATVVLFVALRALAARWWLPNPFDWQRLGIAAVAIGATLGTYSHIVLDGIMHADVRPFAPWSANNPFYRAVSLGVLHMSCLLAGAIGIGICFLRDARRVRG